MCLITWNICVYSQKIVSIEMCLHFSIQVWIILMMSNTSFGYELKCPENLQRSIRIKIVCRGTSSLYKHYSCLFNQLNNTYEESCSESPDFVRPGEKYVVSGFRKNINCTTLRYQPFKLWSYSYSECVFYKSLCSELGQILYHNGSTMNDIACTCDHMKGYAFRKMPSNHFYCQPTSEDCTCYKKSCLLSFSLTSDYKCINSSSKTLSYDDGERLSQDKNKIGGSEEFVGKEPYYSYRRKYIRQTHGMILTSVISVLISIILCFMIFIVKQNMNSKTNMNQNLHNSSDGLNCKAFVNDAPKEKGHFEKIGMDGPNIDEEKQLSIDCEELSCLVKFIQCIGLEDFYPDKLQIRDVFKLQFSKGSSETRDIVLMFVKDIVMTNFKGRDTLLYERLSNRPNSIQNNSSVKYIESILKSKNDKLDNKIINPLDLTIGIFRCSSPMLKNTLALKLFTCKLAVPFIFPNSVDEIISVSIFPLRSIVIDIILEDNSVPKMALDCPCHVVSFVRIGRVSISKSKLANEIIDKHHHNTFFNRECPLGTSKRWISDGLVEAAWYVSAEPNERDKVTLFLNLRGDGKCCQNQLDIVSSLSSVLIILIEMDNLHDEIILGILDSVHSNVAGVILAIDGENYMADEMGEKLELYKQKIKRYEEKTKFCVLSINGVKRGMSEIKIYLKNTISELINRMPLTSLYERIQYLQYSTDEDEINIAKVKETVQKLWDFSPASNADSKLFPMQGKHWESWSQLLKLSSKPNLYKSPVQAGVLKKEMVDERMKQVELCENLNPFVKTFIRSFWGVIDNENESQVFVLLVQYLLNEHSRQITPGYRTQFISNMQSLKHAEGKIEEQKTSAQLEKRVKLEEISNISFAFDHLFREFGQIFEALTEYETNRKDLQEYLQILPKLAAKQLILGQPLELLDGDVGNVPITWLKAVFFELNEILGERKCLVLSVLGIQSSGKSTLLNTMFGLNFAATTGKCSRGVHIQLVQGINSYFPFDCILVVDTEGFRAPGLDKGKAVHDNELATFVVGICDIAIVNIKGENVVEIHDVLRKVVHALLKLNLANKKSYLKQRCIFTHQNVSVQNASEKMKHSRQRFVDILDKMTSKAAKEEELPNVNTFNQVLQLDVENDVWYFSDLWCGDPPMAPANPGYSETVADVVESITNRLIFERETYLSIPDTVTRIEDVWRAILKENFLFDYRNTLEVKALNDIDQYCKSLVLILEQHISGLLESEAKRNLNAQVSQNDFNVIFHRLSSSIGKYIQKINEQLLSFIDKNPLKDIMKQWREERSARLIGLGEEMKSKAMVNVYIIIGNPYVEMK